MRHISFPAPILGPRNTWEDGHHFASRSEMLLHVPVPVPCVSVHLEERKPVHPGLGNWENAVSEGLLCSESLQRKGPNSHPQPHQPAKASDGNYSQSHPLLLPSRGAFHPSRLAVGRIRALPLKSSRWLVFPSAPRLC